MFYLNSGFFKPMSIITTLIFGPLAVMLSIAAISDFQVKWFVGFLIMIGFYFAVLGGLHRYSNSKRNFIRVEPDQVTIQYNGMCMQLQCVDIVKIEYYRISSILAWLMLENFVAPQCVYVTFINNGANICKHIGYLNYNDVRDLESQLRIELVMK